jgi:hypothetical protein
LSGAIVAPDPSRLVTVLYASFTLGERSARSIE